jgi:ABC-type branched-subunit amino acid transport system ATPase component
MLKVENLNVHYGVIHALKDVNIEVEEGSDCFTYWIEWGR